MRKMVMRIPMLLLSIFILSGCVSTPPMPEMKKGYLTQPATLPQYRAGDTFIFSDGSVEKVIAVRGEKVDWESRGGAFRYTTYRNFILPKQQWETETKEVVVQYSGERNILWPLKSGESEYFPTTVVVNDKVNFSKKSYLQSWRCQVGGIYKITLKAGIFDVQKIECDRNTLMGRWMQTRSWFYAPALGHYVLRLDEYAPTSSRRHIQRNKELVAYIPSDQHIDYAEGVSPESHFQHSLESLPSGESSEWRDESDRYARTITMLRTFRADGGRYCREYRMVRRDDGRIQSYLGRSCRGEEGRWHIAVAALSTHT